jgi:hypothetical protein
LVASFVGPFWPRPSSRCSLNARNITSVPQNELRDNSVAPLYSQFYRAESFGVQWAIGLKGSF